MLIFFKILGGELVIGGGGGRGESQGTPPLYVKHCMYCFYQPHLLTAGHVLSAHVHNSSMQCVVNNHQHTWARDSGHCRIEIGCSTSAWGICSREL